MTNYYNAKIRKRGLLLTLMAVFFLSTTLVQAQSNPDGSENVAQADADGASIKLIDNKGTIKYLQSNNGITTVTSTEAGNRTTTTWQLGGELVNDTYIDADGSIFSLDGLKLETGAAATAATSQSGHDASLSGNTTLSPDTGWTLVVRDEATGEIKKLLATDLIESGYNWETADADDENVLPYGEIVIPAGGIPPLAGNEGKIWVYRNGAKLLQATDFAVDDVAGTVTVTGTADFSIYVNDVFEVQWVK